jgi:hypothetical protein
MTGNCLARHLNTMLRFATDFRFARRQFDDAGWAVRLHHIHRHPGESRDLTILFMR